MKSKHKQSNKTAKPRASSSLNAVLGKHFAIWLAVIAIAIVFVGYQIVRANENDGLSLTAPAGSLAREAQLDAIQTQEEAHTDQAYAQQQLLNAVGDDSAVQQLAEVASSAAE